MLKIFYNNTFISQCCKIMPYKIESNEELNSDQIRSKKLNKIETQSDDEEYIEEIIQDQFYINNYNGKMFDKEEKKSNFEYEEESSMFDLDKMKDIFTQSKLLNIGMASYNSNIVNKSEEYEHNNDYKEKNKTYIQINPLGYINSKRKKDGITYFGYEKEGGDSEENEIDIKMNPIDNEVIDDKYYGKHFQIKFNLNDMQYYLKDLGHGFGTFIKIVDWVEIKNNFLLNIGENYLVFSLGLENEINENYINNNNICDEGKLLTVKIFSSNSDKNSLVFSPSDSPFSIGRKGENKIYIEDNMLSRIHCTIKYKNNKWFIIDGSIKEQNDFEENKKSTNGSWVYAYEDSLITDKMTFKAAHYLFECNLTNVEKNEEKIDE